MTYSEDGDTVRLEMTRDEYNGVLLMLGRLAGSESRNGDKQLFWEAIAFVNRLNRTNPNFTQYEIPEEFR